MKKSGQKIKTSRYPTKKIVCFRGINFDKTRKSKNEKCRRIEKEMVKIQGLTKEESPHALQRMKGFPGAVFGTSIVYHDSGLEDICQADAPKMQQTDHELAAKYTPKRKRSILLSESYTRIGYESKASRVSSCGTELQFAYEITPDGIISEKGKLHTANFCKDRLCPMCAWRRSYKIFGQVSKIMGCIGDKYEYIFLTLTVPSVPADSLTGTISRLVKAWGNLIRQEPFKDAVRGFFRALEVTRNNDRNSKSFGLYHPHFHAVLAVPKSYWSYKYISHDQWLAMWRKAYKDDTITQVDIRRAKPKNRMETDAAEGAAADLASAVAEIAKYAVKDSDYLIAENAALTDEIVSTLAGALERRRLSAYGGCFDDAFKKLQLDDAEDGDLIHINEDKINPTLALLIVKYGWTAGAYKMTGTYIKPGESE